MNAFLRRAIVACLLAGLVISAVVLLRTLTAQSRQLEPFEESEVSNVPERAEARLARAIRFETISNQDMQQVDLDEFDRLHEWLAETYPKTHQALERHEVDPCSAYYVWRGSSDERPVLFMAHTDVVPVESHELEEWTHPPFAGEIADGYVWGRGALDVKTGVVGLLEATEVLVQSGYEPERTIYYAFGCDEEVGGRTGAAKIADIFEGESIRFEWVLDEGHAITKGIFPGIDKPVAFIGLAEKGFVTLKLQTPGAGGHSSMPPRNTAVGVLARAIVAIEEAPLDARVNEPVSQMFETLAPEMGFGNRLAFTNLWLLEPVVLAILTSKKTTNATVRTTTAATMFHAGVQDNILPKRAVAHVNFRIAPGDSIETVKAHVIEVIDDPRVRVEVPEGGFKSNPSAVAAVGSHGYNTIARSIRSAFGTDYLVAPSLTVGGTDSRHMGRVADDVYRFLPIELTSEDTARIHGIDERISVENYRRTVAFYLYALREAGR